MHHSCRVLPWRATRIKVAQCYLGCVLFRVQGFTGFSLCKLDPEGYKNTNWHSQIPPLSEFQVRGLRVYGLESGGLWAFRSLEWNNR